MARVPRDRRGWVMRRMLLAVDLAGLLCAFAATEFLFRGQSAPINHLGASFETVVFIASLPAWVVGAKLYGLYDRDSQNADHTTLDEFPTIFHFVTVAVWLWRLLVPRGCVAAGSAFGGPVLTRRPLRPWSVTT